MDVAEETIRFDDFAFCLRTGKLHKGGRHVRLAPQPARVLTVLVRHAGEDVTRELLQEEIWGRDVVVDYERSINSCIKQIRAALKDPVRNPRYVQTIPGIGYKFVPVTEANSASARSASVEDLQNDTRGGLSWLGRSLLFVPFAGAAFAMVGWLSSPKVDTTPEPSDHTWILVSNFGDSTSTPELRPTVEYALKSELRKSPHVSIVPPGRIRDTLRLMKRPPDSVLKAELARELAVRDGGVNALISGEVTMVESIVVVSTTVSEPESGMVIGSAERRALYGDELVRVVRLLAEDLRRILGEKLPPPQSVDQRPLEQATTPSLPALQYFSQAIKIVDSESIGIARWENANQLLRAAVLEDPDFALAHIYLAHGYANRSEPHLAEPHFRRAFELANEVSEIERGFILGSYYRRYANDPVRAKGAYEALLKLHPNHYWAINNLGWIALEARRFDQYAELVHRKAKLRPNDLGTQVRAGSTLMRYSDLERAAAHMEKALALYESDPTRASGYDALKIITFPAIKMWLEDDVGGARSALEFAEKKLAAYQMAANDETLEWMIFCWVGLGELRRAEALAARVGQPARRHTMMVLAALARGDSKRVEAHRRRVAEQLEELGPPLPLNLSTHLFLVGSADEPARLDFAKEWVRVNASRRHWRPEPYAGLALGEELLRRGDVLAAAEHLREGLRLLEHHSSSGYALGLESLAHAHLELGDEEGALNVLGRVGDWRSISPPSSMFFWMRLRLQQATVLRKLGRNADAERIEEHLRHLLRFADNDHVIARELSSRKQ